MKNRRVLTIMVFIWILLSFTGSATAETTNILLLGFDFWEDSGHTRTDTNILLSMDQENGRITLVSLLRDSYVETPGGSWARLNTIVRTHGYKAMCETVSKHYGVSVDKYVGVSMRNVIALIDAMGGVAVTLTREEAGILRSSISSVQGAGTYELDGEDILKYIRLRRDAGNGDFSRVARQQTVLEQAFDKVMNIPIADATALFKMFYESVDTNLTPEECLSLALSALAMQDMDIETLTVPIEGGFTYANVNGASVLDIDWEKNREALQAFLVSGN